MIIDNKINRTKLTSKKSLSKIKTEINDSFLPHFSVVNCVIGQFSDLSLINNIKKASSSLGGVFLETDNASLNYNFTYLFSNKALDYSKIQTIITLSINLQHEAPLLLAQFPQSSNIKLICLDSNIKAQSIAHNVENTTYANFFTYKTSLLKDISKTPNILFVIGANFFRETTLNFQNQTLDFIKNLASKQKYNIAIHNISKKLGSANVLYHGIKRNFFLSKHTILFYSLNLKGGKRKQITKK